MTDCHFIDTHAHLDGEEFKDDLPQVIRRAKDAGVEAVFIPGVDAASVESVMRVCRTYPAAGRGARRLAGGSEDDERQA